MKISNKILGTLAAFLLAACGAEVDQKEIHKISEGSYAADPQREGFGLSGPDMETIQSSSSLSSSGNSLT